MGWGVHDYPSPPDPEPMPRCPECGEECETLYRAADGAIVGCERCIDTIDAYDYFEEREDY